MKWIRMSTEEYAIFVAALVAMFWCFRITQCEMFRIDANKSILELSTTPLHIKHRESKEIK